MCFAFGKGITLGQELALATAAGAGAASVAPLAAASRALRGGVGIPICVARPFERQSVSLGAGSMLSEFPALFPSQALMGSKQIVVDCRD